MLYFLKKLVYHLVVKLWSGPWYPNVYCMIHSVYLPRALYVAAALGIADLLKTASLTIEELGKATETNPRSLFRVMRLLCSYNVFKVDKQGRYGLARHGHELLSDNPASMRWWTLSLGDELWRSNSRILESVRTGDTGFKLAHGQKIWDWYPTHSREHDIFINGMNGFTQVHCRELVKAFDFGRFRKIVDLGGGGGVLIGEILKAFPNVEGVLFDQPRTVDEARPRLQQAGLADRCQAIGGNFFDKMPAGADAYIFKHVLRDWDDKSVLAMLKNCHKAMASDGTLLVIDAMLDPRNNTDRLLKMVDLQLMVDGGGALRTLDEFKRFFRTAGFELVKVHRTAIIDMNIIEARKTSSVRPSAVSGDSDQSESDPFDKNAEVIETAAGN